MKCQNCSATNFAPEAELLSAAELLIPGWWDPSRWEERAATRRMWEQPRYHCGVPRDGSASEPTGSSSYSHSWASSSLFVWGTSCCGNPNYPWQKAIRKWEPPPQLIKANLPSQGPSPEFSTVLLCSVSYGMVYVFSERANCRMDNTSNVML